MSANTCGEILREWRRQQGVSQLDLALRSGYSARHISFVETGRARPSRDALIVLAKSLGMSQRATNALLLAEGFPPIPSDPREPCPSLIPALGHFVDAMERMEIPWAALDAGWNILAINRVGMRFLEATVPPEILGTEPKNMMDFFIAPEPRRTIINLDEAGPIFVQRAYAEALTSPAAESVVARIESEPTIPESWKRLRPDLQGAIHRVTFSAGRERWNFVEMMGTLGTPGDATTQGIRFEQLVPADAATEMHMRALARR